MNWKFWKRRKSLTDDVFYATFEGLMNNIEDDKIKRVLEANREVLQKVSKHTQKKLTADTPKGHSVGFSLDLTGFYVWYRCPKTEQIHQERLDYDNPPSQIRCEDCGELLVVREGSEYTVVVEEEK